MRNISSGLVLAIVAWAGAAAAQPAQGFAVERLSPSAPGAGWFVMDDLSQQGGLGGAVSLSLGYAHLPLEVRSADDAQHLAVVRHEALARVGMAATYDRFRLHASFDSPLYLSGDSGTVGGSHFTRPVVNVEQNPDLISDVQLGFDARLFGEPRGPVRLGASAQLIFPSGDCADYLTDDTYRGTVRMLFAGEAGRIDWAGHVGVHLRPLADDKVPGSPRGSELIFGVAAGTRFSLPVGSLLLGPEIFGATALRSFAGGETTALEGLLSARLDGLGSGGVALVLGAGAGIHPRFGAPQWRAIVGVELAGHAPGAAAGR